MNRTKGKWMKLWLLFPIFMAAALLVNHLSHIPDATVTPIRAPLQQTTTTIRSGPLQFSSFANDPRRRDYSMHHLKVHEKQRRQQHRYSSSIHDEADKGNVSVDYSKEAAAYSSWHCEELARSGLVDVLGKGMGTAHYCIMKNVCTSGESVLLHVNRSVFPGRADGRGYPFPRVVLGGEKFYTLLVDKPLVFEAKRSNSYYKGTTLIIGPSYCCDHMAHFSEPLGVLHEALLRTGYYSNAAPSVIGTVGMEEIRRGGPTKFANLQLSGRIQRLYTLSSSGGPTDNGWTWHLLQMIAQQHNVNVPVSNAVVSKLTTSHGLQCYEEIMVPGALYHIFEDGMNTGAFQRRLFDYTNDLTRRAKDAGRLSNIHPSDVTRRGEIVQRKILLVKRGGRRQIKNFLWFQQKLESWAANKTRELHSGGSPNVTIAIETINFGSHSMLYQAGSVRSCDMLIGIHGADLTNLIFLDQQRNATIVEMNPIFFFESRFREMARHMNLDYTTWNCRRPSCAWGGVSLPMYLAKFQLLDGKKHVSGDYSLDVDQDFNVTLHNSKISFHYPATGYPGSHPHVNTLLSQTSMAHNLYSLHRDSDVFIGADDWKEIQGLLDAKAMSWKSGA